jgi:hypothetical protein
MNPLSRLTGTARLSGGGRYSACRSSYPPILKIRGAFLDNFEAPPAVGWSTGSRCRRKMPLQVAPSVFVTVEKAGWAS